jgi:hypothetical protein
MKVRELLQTELWSKRTSRKIFFGIGIIVEGLIAWIVAEMYWLTPGERKAARIAMEQIDSLQSFESISKSDFAVKDGQAKQEVDVALRAAWTERDKEFAIALSMYLNLTEIDNEFLQRRLIMEQKHPSLTQRDVKTAEEAAKAEKKARLFNRLFLHKALD